MSQDDSMRHSLSKGDIESILRRAIEIDGQSQEGAAEATVREIARELGVSDGAVDRALAEHRHRPFRQAFHIGAIRRTSSFSGTGALSAAGGAFALGAVARVLRPMFAHGTHWESLVSVGLLAGAVALLAWWPRRAHPQRTFQLFNLSAWAGFTAGWTLLHGGIWGDLFGVTIVSAGGSAVLGGIITMLRSRRPRAGSISPPIPSLWGRLRRSSKRQAGQASLPGDHRAVQPA